jgi:AcrR family transcriptional regulator
MKRQQKASDRDQLTERCLDAFIQAGTLDLSLDHLADKIQTSKRMLIHYFGDRQNLEETVMARLEDRLRHRFQISSSPSGISLHDVVSLLWEQSIDPGSRGVLLLIMDVTRRGWSGSRRAKAFYQEQQRLWVELLMKFLPDASAVAALLQLFQGALLVYLVTGDHDQGRRALARITLQQDKSRSPRKPLKKSS